ncbi:MAG: hypothetical protein BZY73_04325 [SAR202 cluster bacterium Casp-Chloro-G3]|nr:MAG: hypothetical protein BZY73_04325 [SAR202 cluster bacterium Casp-Chloro-G3]
MLLTGFSFFFLINVWVEQDALQNEAAAFQEARLESGLSVRSITATSSDCSSFTGPYVALVANTGDSLISDFTKMDALIDYSDSGSTLVVKRLTYPTDWSVASISPDNLDPNSWNPNETATVSLTGSPALGLQTRGRVVLTTPQGVSDSAYFTCVPTQYYLNNNPTPPTGDTNAQAILPMNPGAPTTTLFNYDQDRDGAAGLLILSGGVGADESDSTEHQVWRSGALLDDLHLSSVGIDFWSGVENFTLATTGSATFYLRDFNGSSHTEIGNDSVFDANWQGGSGTFVQRTASIPSLDYTVPEGNELEVKLIVDSSAVNNMWFAYDALIYQATVQVTP